MPCFTRVATSLIDLAVIEETAKKLGIQVIKRTPNSYTLRRGNEQVTIERTKAGEKFFISPFSGTDGYQAEIMKPMTLGYTVAVVKKLYKSEGYAVSAGEIPNQLVFTKYS